ncbi:hypothetical protein NQ156_10895 [Microbacterium sp. zg.Y625]|uniref:hypothetical protein n=1 Tax=Microbacterium jiangjiandongii TaxID=3049071 RepID=UPI00214A9B46|nr:MULTISPECIES: hypothetical protein [unclassified Microbacterium]MCR2793569.1 hypothetical protein [Microbacterium sp. zg.Y625]WIM25923.1 hypothetical protein QNO14_02380 [Microbacterium sp. zg-Y625]
MPVGSDDARARRSRALTTPMRWTLAAVAVVVVGGSVSAGWMLTADEPASTAPPSAAPAMTPGPLPDATPVPGSEVQDPDPAAAPYAGVPPLPTPTPLVAAPLPAGASADGALVEGFPAAVAGPLTGADIVTSSLAVDGGVVQAALTARTDATADEVRADYAARWTALGLAAAGTDTADAFADPFSSVMLAFAAGSGTGTVYTVYAVLRTG